MPDTPDKSRHQLLKDAATAYGAASLENYARVRSLAERIAEGFCAWLAPDNPPCVYLAPPKGDFSPGNYGSAAFSVSGRGFLPLEPISFGLRVSETGDWLRIVITCMQEGGQMVCRIKDGETFTFAQPVTDAALQDMFGQLYRFALDWFQERVDLYESGAYGASTMGFELVHTDPQEALVATDGEAIPLAARESSGT